MKCPYCNHDLDPPSDVPEAPHDNAGDGLVPCPDCKTTGDDPVTPGIACMLCDGSGWV